MEIASGKSTPLATLQTADVDFDGERCVSRRFHDVYFSADGPDEVRRVFLAPAAVAERAQASDQAFTIAELGFGTGLNLVVAAAATRARLHFVSFERHPLSRADLARALKPWRHDHPLVGPLIAAYPPPVPGWHRRFFESGRIQLSVYFGDVGDGLADLRQQQRRGVDAWFLDGFAPKRNPEMWRDALFADIAALCAPGATATTFSAAGDVRRRLAAHGFTVRRVDQRPHKRHSTAAVFAGTGRSFRAPREVVVVGAGLAGTATARHLADKGIGVALLDRGEGVAGGASAIPAAVLHPRLLPTASVDALYRLQSFLHAAAWLSGRAGVATTGVLQLPGPNEPPGDEPEGKPRDFAVWPRRYRTASRPTRMPGRRPNLRVRLFARPGCSSPAHRPSTAGRWPSTSWTIRTSRCCLTSTRHPARR